MGIVSSLDDLRVNYESDGALYPRDALDGFETALALFCAAFGGRQDCLWIAEAGIAATAVDLDTDKLDLMRDLYPADWTFVAADAWEYATRRYAEGETYDLVSLDPPSQLFDWVAGDVKLWTALATRLVVIGTGAGNEVAIPDGWRLHSRTLRSTRNGTLWITLERDE